MPARVTKRGNKFQVKTPGGVKAKGTSKKQADSQARLLNALEHNPHFNPRGR